MEFKLTQEQYEALSAMSRFGAEATGDPNKVRELDAWLRLIEKENGVTRSFVKVQWQELGKPIMVGTYFPANWPPELRADIEYVTRPVARADVDALLRKRASNPHTVLCTRDPAGIVGWTPIDDFFVN